MKTKSKQSVKQKCRENLAVYIDQATGSLDRIVYLSLFRERLEAWYRHNTVRCVYHDVIHDEATTPESIYSEVHKNIKRLQQSNAYDRAARQININRWDRKLYSLQEKEPNLWRARFLFWRLPKLWRDYAADVARRGQKVMTTLQRDQDTAQKRLDYTQIDQWNIFTSLRDFYKNIMARCSEGQSDDVIAQLENVQHLPKKELYEILLKPVNGFPTGLAMIFEAITPDQVDRLVIALQHIFPLNQAIDRLFYLERSYKLGQYNPAQDCLAVYKKGHNTVCFQYAGQGSMQIRGNENEIKALIETYAVTHGYILVSDKAVLNVSHIREADVQHRQVRIKNIFGQQASYDYNRPEDAQAIKDEIWRLRGFGFQPSQPS